LCKSMHIQRYGYSRIAERLNNELYVLETQGIDVDGYPHSLQGALAYIAGDNLNSHLIGGYNASFSPNVLYPCRFCLSSNDDIQKIVTVDCIELRTRDNYDQHSSIDLPQGGQRFGIRHRSEFISGSFHVADGLPPDIMHDLLEGVVPYETALVLKVFLSKKYLTPDELNEILSTWNYGPLDKADKPVPIASGFGETIKQNAGRMWCLVRLLPLMIGLKIPTGDVHWQFFLQLKDIVELAFAPRLAVGHTLLLQTKIQDHIQTFHELFPDRLIKPKQHFLLHYGHSILTYGPLRACWCMRFEAKHFYFSRMMRIVNNYKNSCRTLAERHQMNLAYLLECDNLFSEHEMSLSSAVIVDTNYSSESVVGLLISHKISVDQALHQLTFVHVNGVTYRSSMYVVLTVADDSPVFGRIDAIYVQDMRCVLLVQQCTAVICRHMKFIQLMVSSHGQASSASSTSLDPNTAVPAIVMSQSDASASGDCLTVSMPAVSLPSSVRCESDETVVLKPPVKKRREAGNQCSIWHDNDSISEMKLEWLKSEGVRDNSKLLSLLRKTFDERRSWLYHSGIKTQEFMSAYPALFFREAVMQEYEMVVHLSNSIQAPLERAKKYAPMIINVASNQLTTAKGFVKKLSPKQELMKRIITKLELVSEEDVQNLEWIQSCRAVAGLMLLPVLLGERPEYLYADCCQVLLQINS